MQLQQKKNQFINLSCFIIIAIAFNFFINAYFYLFKHSWKILFILNIVTLLFITSIVYEMPESFDYLF